MSASVRVQKVQRELQQIIGQYLLRGFRGELQGLVTVSRVVVSADLRNAKVFITHVGTPEELEESLDSLNEYAFDVQKQIARELPMKFVPKLSFFHDEAYYESMEIERKLNEIRKEHEDE